MTSFNPFPIQHTRASKRQRVPQLRGVSRNRGKKLNIQNPSVAPLTPSSLNPLPPFRPLRPLRESISSANPKFKIQNPRASASRNRGSLIPSSLNPLTPRYCVAAFTLVELLAVVGIMGLLAAVAVPALKGLTGSGGRKQALSQVMGALEIARNTAIASRTNAAVIFPDATSDSTFGGQTNPYRYRSMAVVAWNATNSATPATMVGSWIVLPQGIALFPNSISALPQTSNISVRILTTTASGTFRGICFQSDGALDETLTPFPTNGIAYFEGTVTGTTTNPTSKMTNFETVRLTRYTGRTLPTLAPAP